MSQAAPDFRSLFADPPDAYRPAPFWWWVGETLERERLLWQLDTLNRGGVKGAVIGYNHFPDGRNDPGDPPVFSEAWWELLRWLVAECRSRGMVLGFQDYTLINPLLAEIGRATPGMTGGELRETHVVARPNAPAEILRPEGCRFVTAMAYPRASPGEPARETPAQGERKSPLSLLALGSHVEGDRLRWTPEDGEWLVSVVWCRPAPFDPMHPQAGAGVIDRLYAPFERHCPGEVGETLAIFFQDELDFGIRMPMWSDRIPQAFSAEKGYDLLENLPALWHDLGPRTAKVRVDYADTVTRLMEAGYFIPIHRWHEERGALFGNDNAGRGAIGTGRRYYGDYFRTMRWYSAPGTDDPLLGNPRAFQGLKVNSSIAQMYGRRRVWVECFHSSGWGATPAEIVAGLNEDFLLGANFVNLHGLYYTTFGSWWEWAAPDFHFRQPYWTAAKPLNDYIARLSALLSQGTHVCDTAILYPITALEGGLNAGLDHGAGLPVSLSEQQRAESEPPPDPAEVTAFRIGRALVETGEDFDFVDFESIERAEAVGGFLSVAGARYRTLVLPVMSTIRFGTLRKARDFHREGGCVVAIGCLPAASERAGAADPEVDALVREIFGGGRSVLVPDVGEALRVLKARGEPDFEGDGAPFQALHRRIANRDVYLVRNPLPTAVRGAAIFRSAGRAEFWNAWTGQCASCPGETVATGRTRMPLELASGEARVVVFDSSQAAEGGPPRISPPPSVRKTLPDDGWEFEWVPTMDNRHGDFRRPPSEGMIGAEARSFRYREEGPGGKDLGGEKSTGKWHRADFDDSGWEQVGATYGQRFWKLGPLPPEALDGPHGGALEDALRRLTHVEPEVPVVIGGRNFHWEPYAFSREWGIERDPFLLDWRSGPHGLKKRVPDEFIDLNCDRPGSVWYLWSSLRTGAEEGGAPLVAGSRAAFSVWIGGEPVLERAKALPAGVHPAWNLPHYESDPLRATVRLRAGDNPLLMRVRQPADQRIRAFVALDAPPVTDRPALRWFAGAPSWNFNPRPRDGGHAGWFRFRAPPGLASFQVRVRGALSVWVDGAELNLGPPRTIGGGISEYTAAVPSSCLDSSSVVLRVRPSPESFGGDNLAGPVRMTCWKGRIALGDWSLQGLAACSGAGWYRRWFQANTADLDGRLELDLGDVRATAEVWCNEVCAGTRVAPPWTFDLTGRVRAGDNHLEVKVANTLANHYGGGIPTPYFFPGQTVSGLLGPVRLLRRRA